MTLHVYLNPLPTRVFLVYSGLFNLGFSWVEIGSVTPKPQVKCSMHSIFLSLLLLAD